MRLDDINLLDRDVFANGVPHEWFTYLRAHHPVFRHPNPTGPASGSSRSTRTSGQSRGIRPPIRRTRTAVVSRLWRNPRHHARIQGPRC